MPPEYNPKKHGSLDKFHGSHPLGIRAKRIHEGILVIRFEMPFKTICKGCGCYVDQGVRFDADKKCVGNYFTTKIWEFAMKCHRCPQRFVIRTDPKTCEYLCISGLRKKISEWDAKDQEGTVEIQEPEEIQKRKNDPMYKLDKQQESAERLAASRGTLQDLIEFNEDRADSYAANSYLRKAFRKEKKELQKKEEEERKPKNFAVPLVEESQEDREEASAVRFLQRPNRLERATRKIAKGLSSSSASIFPSSPAGSSQRGSAARKHIEKEHEEGRGRKRGADSLSVSSRTSMTSQDPLLPSQHGGDERSVAPPPSKKPREASEKLRDAYRQLGIRPGTQLTKLGGSKPSSAVQVQKRLQEIQAKAKQRASSNGKALAARLKHTS
uniref:Splicing factor YJU2 n=1 Tax=Chromera velia CCMP2878 TaxID=1169474 RepID=A0A0G4F7Q1_9ALVE|eukprot:Cvel_15655.t1-p1 / transcript=Cvel_15655.t1 / gene=Cvel_15655 / organism=Chromera_velia_CCMP2878 / gene_product=Coiled-coil domain-containing protein 130, putative / transcript_product=Coiled-coil domain-containing protein 130, putative / location=Cvel_scaffold1168:36459-38405(-) / protein_length=382 / sequence_SO=supercontig / SO=protein_coding / is_pseudo=false